MAEEKKQSPGADEQPIDDALREPSIGMMYDKEKDQAKVFSQNPDGSIGTVDPTPENESLFFIMDKNIPMNFYKNLKKYHNNPSINIYVLPRRGLDRMKEALKRYWNKTTSDDVKLYYRCKMHPDGRYECQMKSRGIGDTEIPWNMLARYGLSYGALEKTGNLKRMKNYEPTGMLKLNYYDNIISGLKGDAKLRLSGKGENVKVDFKFHTNNPDQQIDGVKFTNDDLLNLEKYGNLGRVFETPENRYLVSRDFDTLQTEKVPVDRAFMPRFISGTEVSEAAVETFKRGEACPIVITDRNGNVREVLYQYNVVFRKPMPVMTVEQRNALAKEHREQREVDRIFSSPERAEEQTQSPQTPKQSAEQTPEAAGQGQAPTPAPAVAPEPSKQGQAAETAGQGQAPTPAPAVAPEPSKQGQAPTPGAGQKQGQQQPGGGQKPPRPEVAKTTPRNGRKTGKHV